MPFFFFNDPATTEIYTLSLHDALPICGGELAIIAGPCAIESREQAFAVAEAVKQSGADRKSTRLNSSHITSSYAVFCLKKKNSEGARTHLPENGFDVRHCESSASSKVRASSMASAPAAYCSRTLRMETCAGAVDAKWSLPACSFCEVSQTLATTRSARLSAVGH